MADKKTNKGDYVCGGMKPDQTFEKELKKLLKSSGAKKSPAKKSSTKESGK